METINITELTTVNLVKGKSAKGFEWTAIQVILENGYKTPLQFLKAPEMYMINDLLGDK